MRKTLICYSHLITENWDLAHVHCTFQFTIYKYLVTDQSEPMHFLLRHLHKGVVISLVFRTSVSKREAAGNRIIRIQILVAQEICRGAGRSRSWRTVVLSDRSHLHGYHQLQYAGIVTSQIQTWTDLIENLKWVLIAEICLGINRALWWLIFCSCCMVESLSILVHGWNHAEIFKQKEQDALKGLKHCSD